MATDIQPKCLEQTAGRKEGKEERLLGDCSADIPTRYVQRQTKLNLNHFLLGRIF